MQIPGQAWNDVARDILRSHQNSLAKYLTTKDFLGKTLLISTHGERRVDEYSHQAIYIFPDRKMEMMSHNPRIVAMQ
jgi:hypothetical protein